MLPLFVRILTDSWFLWSDGFFDAGMLRHALDSSSKETERIGEEVIGQVRRAVGKKLRLNEY